MARLINACVIYTALYGIHVVVGSLKDAVRKEDEDESDYYNENIDHVDYSLGGLYYARSTRYIHVTWLPTMSLVLTL